MADIGLSSIIDVSVQMSQVQSFGRGFNTALILGPSSEATYLDNPTGIKFYENISEVLEDFSNSTNVYSAASLYFGQEYRPSGVYVGCVGSDESVLSAVQRCRELAYDWYVCIPTVQVVTSMNTQAMNEVSSYVESVEPSTIVAYSLTNSASYKNIISNLKSNNFKRTISQYEDVSVNTGDANKTIIAGIIGYALGRNRTFENAYTLAYKSISGISPMSSISASDVKYILDNNSNIYLTQGYYYNLFRQGKMANGNNFDEIIYIDMLVDRIKTSLMNALVQLPKIPQTEEGTGMLTNEIMAVLEEFRSINFIAPGVWNGPTVGSLSAGDALGTGYLIQFDSIASQTAAERASRIAPKCYICIKLAGAIEHIAISIVVDR